MIRGVAAQENGAEFASLDYLAGMVFRGESVEPEFQQLINLIVAKAVIHCALPLQKLGRPKREELDSIGRTAAARYWEMIDSGSSYELAVEAVSAEFHKSERHIMRLIAPHKDAIGATPEGGCKNFCVNGQLAGNCCTSMDLQINDRHERTDRQPAG